MNILVVSNDHTLASSTVSKLTARQPKRTDFTPASLEHLEAFIDTDSRDRIGIYVVGSDSQNIIEDVRAMKVFFPAIAAPSPAEKENAILLLDSGFDDVVRQDISTDELVARFRAISRRAIRRSENTLNVGQINFHLDGRDPEIAGKPIKLSNIEYSILETLARRNGNVVSREVLFERVWPNSDKQPFDKVLDVHIHNLRSKFVKAGGDKAFISTIPSRGFILTGTAS